MAPPRTPRGIQSTASPSRSSTRAATSSPYSRPTTKTTSNKKSSPSAGSAVGLLGRIASFVSPFRPSPNSSAFARDGDPEPDDDQADEDEIDEEMALGTGQEGYDDLQHQTQELESGNYLSSNSKGKGRMLDDQEENPAQRLNRRGREMESNQPQNSLYPPLPNHPATPHHFGPFVSQNQQSSSFQTPQNNFNPQINSQHQIQESDDPTSPLTQLRKFFIDRNPNAPLTDTELAGITELVERSHGRGGTNSVGMNRDELEAIGYGYGGLNQRGESLERNVEGRERFERSPSVVSQQSRGGTGMRFSNSAQGIRASSSLNHVGNHSARYGSDFTSASNFPRPSFVGSSTPNSNRINSSKSLNSFPFSFSSNQTIKAQPSSSTEPKNNAPLPYRRRRPIYLGPGMSGKINNASGGLSSTGLVRSQSAGTGLVNRKLESKFARNREDVREEEEEQERDSKRRKDQRDETNRVEDSSASAGFHDQPSNPNAGLPIFSNSANSFIDNSSPARVSAKRARQETQGANQSNSEIASASTPSKTDAATNINGSEKKLKSRTASAMLDILAKDQNTSLLSKNQQSTTPNGTSPSAQVTKSDLFNPYQANKSPFTLSNSSNPMTPSKTTSSSGLRRGRLSATPAAEKERERLRLEREKRKNQKDEARLKEEEELKRTREEEREKIREREEKKEEERRKQGLLGRVERSYGAGAGGRKSASPSKGSSELESNKKTESNNQALLMNSGRDYTQNKPKKPSPLGMISSSNSNSSELSVLGEQSKKSSNTFVGFGTSSSSSQGLKSAFPSSTSGNRFSFTSSSNEVPEKENEDEQEDEDEDEVEGELGNDSQTEDEEDDQEQEDEEDDEDQQLADDVEDDEAEVPAEDQDEEGQPEQEEEEEEVQTPPPPPSKQGSTNKPAFSFGQSQVNPSPSKSVAWSDTPIKSAESKPQSKDSTPTTPVSILSKSKSNSNSISFNHKPNPAGDSAGPTKTFENPPSTPKDEAKSVPVSSLPSFDFSLPQSSSFDNGDDLQRKIRSEVKEIGLKSLPSFEFLVDSTNFNSPSTKTAETSNESSKSQLQPPPFSFNPSPASGSASNLNAFPASTSTTSAPSNQNGESNPESNPASDDVSSTFGSSDKGEGEESESTLYETRAKFFALRESAWTSLGIAIVKIKKNDETGKKRLLARHEANKKVLVNFSLYSTLTCKRESKTDITFLGFEDGKPLNLMCRIKPEDKSEEFKSELEQAASSI